MSQEAMATRSPAQWKKKLEILNKWQTGIWECEKKRQKKSREEKDKMLEDNVQAEKTSGEKWTVTISNCGRIKAFWD